MYTVTVGDGGADGDTADSDGYNGYNSSFGDEVVAMGGGGGGMYYRIGKNGGSGGGGGYQGSQSGGAIFINRAPRIEDSYLPIYLSSLCLLN